MQHVKVWTVTAFVLAGLATSCLGSVAGKPADPTPAGAVGMATEGGRAAIVLDQRELLERADVDELVAAHLTAGVVDAVHAIREPELLERPLDAQVRVTPCTIG